MIENHQEALNAALRAIDKKTSEPLMRAKARGLIVGYHHRWMNQDFVTIAVEDLVTAELFNPDTGARSRTFTMAGKVDVRAELNGRPVLIDHKTTSDDITDPNGPYWSQLIIEGQLSHYMLLEWLNGRKPQAATWDVIRKPSISPRQLTKQEQQQITFTKKWFGLDLDDKQVADAIAAGRETVDLYELRLIHDCTVDRPERYFQRRSIPRLDSEIIQFASELWDHSQNLIASRRHERHPRNSGACMTYNTPCVFLGVCSGHDDIESDKWQRAPWVHKELPVLNNGNGSDVLTNSRVKTWQTCQQKHFYQYELGVERVEPEDRESLVFGTLMHEALAAWWEHFKLTDDDKGERYGDSNSAPTNAAGIAA